jgi:hypothetical protein
MRFLMKGPRSLTRTVRLAPVARLVTSSSVPSGSVRWAAVRPAGSKISPEAVGRPANSSP